MTDARLEHLQSLIEQYGYFAVFLGCFLEGETVLVLGGFAAHMGYLSLPDVIATAAVAGFIGDQALFWIGRRWGDEDLRAPPEAGRAAAARQPRCSTSYGGWAAFGIRFMVGMRLAGAIAIGASGFPQRRFMPANAAGAIVWAVLIGSAGLRVRPGVHAVPRARAAPRARGVRRGRRDRCRGGVSAASTRREASG